MEAELSTSNNGWTADRPNVMIDDELDVVMMVASKSEGVSTLALFLCLMGCVIQLLK